METSARLWTGVLHGLLLVAAPGLFAGAAARTNPDKELAKLPAQDPAVTELKKLKADAGNRHPRLLFFSEDVAKLKEKIQGAASDDFAGLEKYLPSCAPPKEVKFLTDATDAQRHGLWRLPTVALHYVLTGKKSSLEHARGYLELLLKLPHWEEGTELDCGMGAANIMVGAALAYDWLYADLDSDFREKFRQKLLAHARRMYYLGHLQKADATHYWQQDPQNNHRAHRLAGLTLAALALAEGKPEEDWILARTWDELKFVGAWLSEDGSYHDSPSYMPFGVNYLVLAFDAADRCFGTDYLGHAFFKHNPSFRMQTLTPGLKNIFQYGDSGEGAVGTYNNYLLRCAARHRQADAYAGVLAFFKANENAAEFKWFSILWRDPAVESGALERLPAAQLFPDMGLVFVRDGWKEENTGAMFKCGPYGGYLLNRFRNEGDFRYINVAHDHPDANSFQLFARGAVLATDDGYPEAKQTAPHNTLLVDGKGQRGESKGWLQPLPKEDMAKLANLIAFKDAGTVVAAEGEAGRLYPGLTRFRRAFVWVKGAYVLVLDDIRADGPHELTWMLHSPALSLEDEAAGRFVLKKEQVRCPLQLVASPPGKAALSEDEGERKGKDFHRGQKLHLTAKAANWRVAAVFDAWEQGPVSIEAEGLDGERPVLRVKGKGIADAWTWAPAPDAATPATLKLVRQGGETVEIGPADRLPLPK